MGMQRLRPLTTAEHIVSSGSHATVLTTRDTAANRKGQKLHDICSLTTRGWRQKSTKERQLENQRPEIKRHRGQGTSWMEISCYFELNENESKNLSKLVGCSRSNALREIGSI